LRILFGNLYKNLHLTDFVKHFSSPEIKYFTMRLLEYNFVPGTRVVEYSAQLYRAAWRQLLRCLPDTGNPSSAGAAATAAPSTVTTSREQLSSSTWS